MLYIYIYNTGLISEIVVHVGHLSSSAQPSDAHASCPTVLQNMCECIAHQRRRRGGGVGARCVRPCSEPPSGTRLARLMAARRWTNVGDVPYKTNDCILICIYIYIYIYYIYIYILYIYIYKTLLIYESVVYMARISKSAHR